MKMYDAMGSTTTKWRKLFIIDDGNYYYGFKQVDAESDFGTMSLVSKSEYQYNQAFNDSSANIIIRNYYLPNLETVSYDSTTNTFTDLGGNSIRIENGKIVELIYHNGGYFKYTIDYTTPVIDQVYTIE